MLSDITGRINEFKPTMKRKPWQVLETMDHTSSVNSVLKAFEFLPDSQLKHEVIVPVFMPNPLGYLMKNPNITADKETQKQLVHENPLLQLAFKPDSMEAIPYPRVLENLIANATNFTPEEQQDICLAIEAIKNR